MCSRTPYPHFLINVWYERGNIKMWGGFLVPASFKPLCVCECEVIMMYWAETQNTCACGWSSLYCLMTAGHQLFPSLSAGGHWPWTCHSIWTFIGQAHGSPLGFTLCATSLSHSCFLNLGVAQSTGQWCASPKTRGFQSPGQQRPRSGEYRDPYADSALPTVVQSNRH